MSPLLILGASTRSAAHSAVRAGLRPLCADRFTDADLRAVAEVLPLSRYPQGLPQAVQHVPPCPWMYAGALENSPEMIAQISAGRPLWGNPAEVVNAVRDPQRLYAVLAEAGLPALAVRFESNPPSPDGRWMLKPRRSAAGRGITSWTPMARRSPTLNEPHYFQRRCPGSPMSALFLAKDERTWMIGIARQWVGETWLGAPPFRYCGSIGPISLDEDLQTTMGRIGAVLADRFRLRGLFGVDFLCDGRDVWLTEVNPRYTASVEVFEHALAVPLLDWHRRAFVKAAESRVGSAHRSPEPLVGPAHPTRVDAPDEASQIVGKAILYAERTVTIPWVEEFSGEVAVHRLPCIADRPAPGSRIPKGGPICTVLAAGENEGQCRDHVIAAIRSLRNRLNLPRSV